MTKTAVWRKSWTWLVKLLLGVGFVLRFVLSSRGRQYRVGRLKKLWLLIKVIRNNLKLKPLSTTRQHLLLVEQILSIPRSVPGDVVECGCYNGASTANLSLACGLTDRRLFVCDSFEGLPEPDEDEEFTITGTDCFYQWSRGDYTSEGGLEGVRERIRRFGNIEVCRFVKGYFEHTLKDLDTDSVVLVFEDADLASSVRDCLLHLWPKLQEGCRFYSHEPWSVEVVSLFYDRVLWEGCLGTPPPGYFGAITSGMVGKTFHTSIGYAEKLDTRRIVEHGRRVVDSGTRVSVPRKQPRARPAVAAYGPVPAGRLAAIDRGERPDPAPVPVSASS